MPLYKEHASGAGYIYALAAVAQAAAIKEIKAYKDPRTGKTINVYVTEQIINASVGPAVGTYNDVVSTNLHPFTIAPGAVFLDTQLQWDQFANDIDLFLDKDDGSGTFAQQGASQGQQALTLTAREGVAIDYPGAGKWQARVQGWLNAPQTYTLTVQQYFPLQ